MAKQIQQLGDIDPADVERLNYLSLNEVLEEGATERYDKLEKPIWDDLVRAHTNIALIEKTHEHPFKLAGGAGFLLNWLLTETFFSTVNIVHRIQNDLTSGTLTIGKLKEWVATNVRTEYRAAVLKRLKEAKPSKDERAALKKIRDLRHDHLAHKNELKTLGEVESVAGITLDELKLGLAAATRMYMATRVGVDSEFVMRNPVEQMDYTISLLIANSDWSKRYETNPELWNRVLRPKLTDEDIEAINRARRRHGMLEIPTEDSE